MAGSMITLDVIPLCRKRLHVLMWLTVYTEPSTGKRRCRLCRGAWLLRYRRRRTR
jgi:hypothetical protein